MSDNSKISKFFSFYKKGSMIFRELDIPKYLFYIKERKVALIKKLENSERIISVLGAGDIFGEMVLNDSSLRIFSSKAVEDTTLIKMDEETLKNLMSTDAEFIPSVFKSITNRIVKLSDLLEVANINNNELKVISLLLKYLKTTDINQSNISLNLSEILNYISDQIKISAADTAAVLQKLEKLKYININFNEAVINDYKKLVEYETCLKESHQIS